MLKYFLFFFGTLSIYAQKEYCFQYDSAGNQRRALLCLNATDEATDEEIFDELPDNLKSSNSDNSKVQLYGVPNPATDQIGVYWQHSENGALTHLAIFTLNGQLMQQIDNLPPTEPYHINISTWSAGYYFMVATFSDGSKKIFKIVNNKAEMVNVKSGRNFGDKVEIISGLTAGDEVITSGQINIDNGTPIKIVQ